MKRVAFKDIEIAAGQSEDYSCVRGTRHDIFVSGGDLQVDALSNDGQAIATIKTVANGEPASIDFATDNLRLTASGGTVHGELRSFRCDTMDE